MAIITDLRKVKKEDYLLTNPDFDELGLPKAYFAQGLLTFKICCIVEDEETVEVFIHIRVNPWVDTDKVGYMRSWQGVKRKGNEYLLEIINLGILKMLSDLEEKGDIQEKDYLSYDQQWLS